MGRAWSRRWRRTSCAKAFARHTRKLNRHGARLWTSYRERSINRARKKDSMKERFDGLIDHLLQGSIFLPQAIELLERSMIQRALELSGGNQCAASKQLG